MPDKTISVRTRKRLWARSGDHCAFPGCDIQLLQPIAGVDEDTIVGVECHIVAQEDSPAVARSVSSLTEEEKIEFADLIESRHGYSNLVLMCGTHSTLVDDPNGNFDVARVVKIKREHEESIDRARSGSDRRAETFDLQDAAIIDGWGQRVALDEWTRWLAPVFGDGHPRMNQEDFDRLTEARSWMFSRVWSGRHSSLEQAFENFRYVAQDLQLTFERYASDHFAEMGLVAPVRFYNDAGWIRQFDGDFSRLDAMYEWLAFLLEDLALELTRAANLVCQAVRETIDPRYRLEEGWAVLESGPYMDFTTRLHRPRYSGEDGWRPYRGIEHFVVDRGTRDECRNQGGPPEGLSLPGDTPFDSADD